MTAVKLDKNAARDIWAAELRNGAEAAYRFGPVTGNLVAVLKELHESVDGGADDPPPDILRGRLRLVGYSSRRSTANIGSS